MPSTTAVDLSLPNSMELTANPYLRRSLVKTRMPVRRLITLCRVRPALTPEHLRLLDRIQRLMMTAVQSTVQAESVPQMNRIRLRFHRLTLQPCRLCHVQWVLTIAMLIQPRPLKSSQIPARHMATTVLSNRHGALRRLWLHHMLTLLNLHVLLRRLTRRQLQALRELPRIPTRQRVDCNHRRPLFRSALTAGPLLRLRHPLPARDLRPPRRPRMATSRALAGRR
jgi:hypothetical protein